MIHTTWHTRTVRRLLAAVAAGAVLMGCGIGWAGTGKADTIGACKTDLWGFLASQRRELCDGQLHPDGSWLRQRVIYVPAHQVPFNCYYGRYSSSCSGGYFQPYAEVARETYPVTPDTVLPDEPGHLA